MEILKTWLQFGVDHLTLSLIVLVRLRAGGAAEGNDILGWELCAISPSPPDLQEESAGWHSEVKNDKDKKKRGGEKKSSGDGDLQNVLTQESLPSYRSFSAALSVLLSFFSFFFLPPCLSAGLGRWSMVWLRGAGSVFGATCCGHFVTRTRTFMVMGVLALLVEVPGLGLDFGDEWQLECATQRGGCGGGGGEGGEGSRGHGIWGGGHVVAYKSQVIV